MGINVRIRDGICPDASTGEGGATEGDIRGSFSDIIDIVGVKDLSGGHCLVTQNSPAAMSVLVAPGVVYIPNAAYNELDSNTVKFWEAVITVYTAVVITANTSGSTRIDLICVKMDTAVTPDEHASNIATLVAVAGTPGAGVPATPDNYAKLAEIEVANGASTIVTADITDSRVQSTINGDYVGASVSVTTKGDLQTHNGTAPARLAVGSDGQSPIADSSKETGLSYFDNNSSMARQAIINGNFDVWQRGTSFLQGYAGLIFSADRWKHGQDPGSAYTVSRQDGTGVVGSQYCLRLHRTAGNTGTTRIWTAYSMETVDSIKLRGKKLTLSFYTRKGANLSGTLAITLKTGTGTDEFSAAYTGSADVATENLSSITTSWVKHTITTTNVIADTVTEIGILIEYTPSGTAGALDYWEIAQVQLCAGDVALPFMPKSYEEELRACQRYFIRYSPAEGTNFYNYCLCTANSTTNGKGIFQFPTAFRTNPTRASNGNFLLGGITVTSVSDDQLSRRIASINFAVASGLTARYCYELYQGNDSTGYIDFSAEL